MVILLLLGIPLSAVAAETFVNRREGFLTIWRSLGRPALVVRAQPFADVPEGDPGSPEITYAKARGILDEAQVFRPGDPLLADDALVWLLRMRSVDAPEHIQPATLSGYLLRYPIFPGAPKARSPKIEADSLVAMMRTLDTMLADEVHEVSLYAEKFHGKGTAFGETFDMHALTAAHRTFPGNTLVRVTNVENGRSVVVRINDRGPFVAGRDMDLSLAAFTAIADRAKGIIRARFERLGDATLVGDCARLAGQSLGEGRYQERLARDVRLAPGIPHVFRLGETLILRANRPFVVRSVRYPDGVLDSLQDWIPSGDRFVVKPSMAGAYVFRLGTLDGRHRTMTMRVVECGG